MLDDFGSIPRYSSLCSMWRTTISLLRPCPWTTKSFLGEEGAEPKMETFHGNLKQSQESCFAAKAEISYVESSRKLPEARDQELPARDRSS